MRAVCYEFGLSTVACYPKDFSAVQHGPPLWCHSMGFGSHSSFSRARPGNEYSTAAIIASQSLFFSKAFSPRVPPLFFCMAMMRANFQGKRVYTDTLVFLIDYSFPLPRGTSDGLAWRLCPPCCFILVFNAVPTVLIRGRCLRPDLSKSTRPRRDHPLFSQSFFFIEITQAWDERTIAWSIGFSPSPASWPNLNRNALS